MSLSQKFASLKKPNATIASLSKAALVSSKSKRQEGTANKRGVAPVKSSATAGKKDKNNSNSGTKKGTPAGKNNIYIYNCTYLRMHINSHTIGTSRLVTLRFLLLLYLQPKVKETLKVKARVKVVKQTRNRQRHLKT